MIDPCPRCKGPLELQVGGKALGTTADGYKDCCRICPACGIGITNSSQQPTFIWKEWASGLWRAESISRLEAILPRSLNEQSRPKKKLRLANERSEDLLTWNAFSWLEEEKLLAAFLEAAGHPRPGTEPRIFYWGAHDIHRLEIAGRPLEDLLVEKLGERSYSLSEPDLMLATDDEIILIELKFGSSNDRFEIERSREKFGKYLKAVPHAFVDAGRVADLGFYELTRYWAIGAAMVEAARGGWPKRFSVLNLVREGEEEASERELRKVFQGGNYRRITWEQHVAPVAPAPLLNQLRRTTLYFKPAFPRLHQG